MQFFLNKILTNQTQEQIKESLHCDQLGFVPESQGWFNKHKSMYVLHHINKLKDRNNVIIFVDTEKAFDKVQHAFIIKKLRRF